MKKEIKELITLEDLMSQEERLIDISIQLDLPYIFKRISFVDGYLIILGPDSLDHSEMFYCKRNCEVFDYIESI